MSFISRCGNCTNQNLYNQPDICNIPTPSNYSACYQKVYSSFNPNCEPGYKISCDYSVEGSRTLLCCPDMSTADNLYSINCSGGTCSIKISYQNRILECSSATSLIACLNDPDTTYVNGVESDFPIPWLIYPKEIYESMKTLSSPCAGLDDYSCLPYSEIYKASSLTDTSGLCPSGELNNYAYFDNNISCSLLESKGNCQRVTGSCPVGMTQMSTSCNNSDGSILCCTMPNTECYTLANFVPTGTQENNIFCQMACPSYADQVFIGVDTPCDSTYYDICTQTGCPIDPVCSSTWTKQQIANGVLMPNRLPTVIAKSAS